MTLLGSSEALIIAAGVVGVLVTALVMLLIMIVRERNVHSKLELAALELQHCKAGSDKKSSNDVTNAVEPFKKHILQSAFDLQSRLANQVNANFLHEFYGRSLRDREYAAYSTAYFFAEFLCWLEVVRQRVVFVTGSEYAEQLNCLIESIKFQFTGETPIQGCAPKSADLSNSSEFYDAEASAMQLYIVDIRSIGNSMLVPSLRGPDGELSQFPRPITCDEFIKRVASDRFPSSSDPGRASEAGGVSSSGTNGRLPPRAGVEENSDASFQRSMMPLTEAINHLASLPTGRAPKKRLALLQVLLCKLIDILDSSVAWDLGPKFDAEEEPRYIQRDIRLTPGVKHLSPIQVLNLSQQNFFATSDPNVSFPGFREDLAHKSQHERDDALWLGACPPREPRRRDTRWVQQFRYSQGAAPGLASAGVRRRKTGQRAVDAGAPMPTDAAAVPGGPRSAAVMMTSMGMPKGMGQSTPTATSAAQQGVRVEAAAWQLSPQPTSRQQVGPPPARQGSTPQDLVLVLNEMAMMPLVPPAMIRTS